MRVRTRPAYTPEELAVVYGEANDDSHFPAHVQRIAHTIELARRFGPVSSVGDLSCGAKPLIAEGVDAEKRYLGDFAPGHEFCGPIEQTLEEMPYVDMFVFSETIEHLDDPDHVLALIRPKTDVLILSTPLIADAERDDNAQHYWNFGKEDIEEMLLAAGFDPVEYAEFDDRPWSYRWQIWGCR